jgi:hypothetical protein
MDGKNDSLESFCPPSFCLLSDASALASREGFLPPDMLAHRCTRLLIQGNNYD